MKKWQHFSLSLPNTYGGKHKYFLSSNQTKLEKSKGETTILVPQVYHVCTIGPLSLKRVQLVPQVLKLS